MKAGDYILIFKDEKYFEQYQLELLKATELGEHKNFMRTKKYPDVFIRERKTLNGGNSFDEHTIHYSEISVDLINGCNVSSSRCEIVTEENFIRVIDSIDYIINNCCDPIIVITNGHDYYIHDGKHRFYAHVLLGKKTIPVSLIRLNSVGNRTKESNEIVCLSKKSNFYNPDEAVAFFRKYKDAFGSVMEVKMMSEPENFNSQFAITNQYGDEMKFVNCCTSGNEWRSSVATYEILKDCGFKVSKEYVFKNRCFNLADSRDPHLVNFEIYDFNWNSFYESLLGTNIKVEKHNKYEQDIFKLHDYICREKSNNTKGTHLSWYSSYVVEAQNQFFYFVGSEDQDSSDDRIYIFEDASNPFDNMKVKFIGKVSKGQEEYTTLLKFLKEHSNND